MVNYNKVIREPFTEETQVPAEKLIREPITESLLSNKDTTPSVQDMPPTQEHDNEATVVCHSNLNVRQSADILSSVVAVLRSGDAVVVEDVKDDWAHIHTSLGIEGYSLSEYIVATQVK